MKTQKDEEESSRLLLQISITLVIVGGLAAVALPIYGKVRSIS